MTTKAAKFLYTLITPEGVEVLVGAFASDASAARAIRRKHAADWLQLACYPLQQRAVRPGEKIQAPRRWTADDARDAKVAS
jgi:hypothetical protein